MINELKQFVSLVVESLQFSLKEFKELSNNDALNYAKSKLMTLGTGSSRATFLLNSKKVLKIAINELGELQNKVEVHASTKNAPVAKIYEHDPNGKWIIMELVRQIEIEEFENLTGIDYEEFYSQLEDIFDSNVVNPYYDVDNVSPFVSSVAKFIKDNNLIYTDAIKVSSWGKSAAGHAVIFDYGLDKQTKAAYRAKKRR